MKKFLIAIGAVTAFSSCTQVAGWFGNNKDSISSSVDSSSYAAFAPDESITAANAYSDLFLDSNAVEQFIQSQKLADSSANTMRNFYRVRNYQFAWFSTDGPTEQARGLWSLQNAIDEKEAKESEGLNKRMDSLLQKDSLGVAANDSSYVQTELSLTKQLMDYASAHPEHINSSQIYYLVPAKKVEAMSYADSLLHKMKDSARYSSNAAYVGLKKELAELYEVAKAGGWKPVPAGSLKKGSRSAAVKALKQRFIASGDYYGNDTSDLYNDSLSIAVKDMQIRYGMPETGNVNDSLIKILNVPADQRIRQVLVNMNRVLWMPVATTGTRVEVNIPSQMLYAYADSGLALQMPVIVGKEGNSTVMFSSAISQIIFNPSWNIPESIVRNEIVPKIKADATYLKKNNIERVGGTDSLPVLKQMPGKNNSLGKAKFIFPNSHDIYLHDTPDKSLFSMKDRALSHGCIRVADAAALARFLLRDESGWDAAKINSAMNSGKEQTVNIGKPYPVAITYLTTLVDGSGHLSYREDLYRHDEEAASKMFL